MDDGLKVSRTNETIYRRPFIPLLLGLMGGIAGGAQLPGYRWTALILVIFLFALSIIQLAGRRAPGYLPCLLFAVLGYLSIQPWLCPRFAENHIVHFADDDKWDIVGTVSDHPNRRADRCYFTLAAQTVAKSQSAFEVHGGLRVTLADGAVLIHKGDRLRLSSAKIRPVRSFQNPGGFDYRRYMAYRGIWVRTFIRSQQLRILDGTGPSGLENLIRKTRLKVETLIDQTYPGDHQAVLKALLLGQKHQISPELRDHFNRVGIGHLLAISGLHIGIVAASAFLFFSFILKFSQLLLLSGRVKQVAGLLSLGPVIFYALLAGLSPSTQRAVIMVSVFMLGHVIYRDQDVVNTLAVAALIILAVNPPALFNVSFQLSFAAVLGIVMGLDLVPRAAAKHHQARIFDNVARRAGVFFMVSVFALIATLPLVMHTFNRISLISAPVNFILVPIVAFWVVPVGLGAVFLSFLHSTPALWLLRLDGWVLEHMLALVRWLSNLPFAAIRTFTPTLFEMACFYLLVGSMYAWAVGSPRVHPIPRPPPVSGTGWAPQGPILRPKRSIRSRLPMALCLLALVLISADTVYWIYQRFWRNDLRVTAIDVGQGSANLLELPRGYCILIDGGGFSDNAIFDVGARVIAPLLLQRKIMSVDLIVLSHANSDHLNGLIHIAEHFNPRAIWTNNQPQFIQGFQQLLDVIGRHGINHPAFSSLNRTMTINGVTLLILYPPKDFLQRSVDQKWRSTNNNSIVIKITYGDIGLLFPGDIMTRAEKELEQIAPAALQSQVLMAAHHGSRSSSSVGFVRAVRPEVVIISCGWNNRFGFPHPVVLNRLETLKARIYRTDRNGAITLTTDGANLQVSVQADQ